MPSNREAWERVLATIEAEARRAEALLTTPVEEFPPNQTADRDETTPEGLPADWMLPAAPTLPPLESMPPVPAELSDRILTIRAQIMHLQQELAEALRTLPRSQPRPLAGVTPSATPSYLDRRL